MLHSEAPATGCLSKHFIIFPPHCFGCVLMLLEGISWGNKPEKSQIRPNKSTHSSPLGIQSKVLAVHFALKCDSSQLSQWEDSMWSFAIRIILGLQRIWLLSTLQSQIWRKLKFGVVFIHAEISISLGFNHNTPQPIQAYSHIYKIPVNPSGLNCFVNEKERKNLLSVQLQLATQRRTQKDSAFVNTNINIPPDRCGAVIVNWGPVDWFSFSTRAVERQFNFLSRLPSGRLFFLFYFSAFLSKKCQHDFVSTKHILCCDRYHLTPIYEKAWKRHIPAAQYEYIIFPMCPVFSAWESYWRMCWKSERPSLK